jgi:hypothetical protein
MNYRLQLSPLSHSTGRTSAGFREKRNSRVSWENANFFRSWLVYDSGVEQSRTHGRVNWNVIAGLTIMAGTSAGGWYGISMLMRYLLKVM